MRLPEQLIEAIVLKGHPNNIDTVIVEGEVIYNEKHHNCIDPRDAREKLISDSLALAKRSSIVPIELLNRIRPHVIDYYKGWMPFSTKPYYLFNACEWVSNRSFRDKYR
jgi:hypothetical protein